MPQRDYLDDKMSWADLQESLANTNINVLNVSECPGGVAIVVEYLFERKTDHKLIWPKTVFAGSDLSLAMREALETIREIRASEDR